jgi:hypothetical protein
LLIFLNAQKHTQLAIALLPRLCYSLNPALYRCYSHFTILVEFHNVANLQEVPKLDIPLHTLIELTPKADGTMAETRFHVDVDRALREIGWQDLDEAYGAAAAAASRSSLDSEWGLGTSVPRNGAGGWNATAPMKSGAGVSDPADDPGKDAGCAGFCEHGPSSLRKSISMAELAAAEVVQMKVVASVDKASTMEKDDCTMESSRR